MFFAKAIKQLKSVKRKVTVNLDFNKTNGGFVKQQNVILRGNGLTSTVGFVNQNVRLNPTRTAFQINNVFVVQLPSRGLYSFKDGMPYSTLVSVPMDCVIGHVECQGRAFFSCIDGTYYTDDGLVAYKINDKYFPSIAMCYDRIFGVNGKTLSMTNAGDTSEWNDSLTISSHTNLDAVVALDKLYVLGDTCYTLVPNAEELNMKFAPFAYDVGTVQVESVVTTGKRALFASTNGLYELKSNTITPIFDKINDYVSFDGCSACMYEGKYYVSCKRKGSDMTANDVVLVLDVNNWQIDGVIDEPVSQISAVDKKLYAIIDKQLYVGANVDVDSAFVVENVDFDCPSVKYLHKLSIRTLRDADVWITSDNETRRYKVSGKNLIQTIPIQGAGRQFSVQVHTKGAMQLNYLALSARSYEV